MKGHDNDLVWSCEIDDEIDYETARRVGWSEGYAIGNIGSAGAATILRVFIGRNTPAA